MVVRHLLKMHGGEGKLAGFDTVPPSFTLAFSFLNYLMHYVIVSQTSTSTSTTFQSHSSEKQSLHRKPLKHPIPIPGLRKIKMTTRYLTAKSAAALDAELMSSGAFSLDQLMELAGLSVSQALYQFSPPDQTPKVLVACGPGNNGGDGLVAARHLFHFGYRPAVYWPKEGKHELYGRLKTQLEQLKVPFIEDFQSELASSDVIVDAIFGFSFKGEVREPFPSVIEALAKTGKPVLAVDAPSSWDIEMGPRKQGCGKGYMPQGLISLTAPKPLVEFFRGRHWIGGRFVGRKVANRFGFDVPEYPGGEQVVEVGVGGGGKGEGSGRL